MWRIYFAKIVPQVPLPWYILQKLARVIIGWRFKDLSGTPLFNDLAGAHDHNLVRYFTNDGQVMGDKQVAQAQVALQFSKQIQNLLLYRGVKRRQGFVEYDQSGFKCQSASDGYTLSLAP